MASSVIHLAITEGIAKKWEIKDIYRLRLGAVLPDGAIHGNGHLKIRICDETRSTYDLEGFRERFGEKMKEDDLYLGYYLHLVQDIFYRYYVYSEHNWDPLAPGNVERLYQDYRITNEFVIEKYNLKPDLIRHQDLAGEPLLAVAEYDVKELVERIRGHFVPVEDTGIFFFTREMAGEFVERATVFCLEELQRFSEGKPGLGNLEWSWERHS
ncbi:MAG: hypothetical protein IK081_02695 [Lachnospiraceae bacterium]|nr:hypothetical protein [Lachnospiraceae bacterium]